MLTARYTNSLVRGSSLPGAKAAFISAAKRSITEGWRASAFQTLLMLAGSMPRAWAMPSTTALARGFMSLYSVSLAMAHSTNKKRHLPVKGSGVNTPAGGCRAADLDFEGFRYF